MGISLHTSDKSPSTLESFRKTSLDIASYNIQNVSWPRWLRGMNSRAILGAVLVTTTLVCHWSRPFKETINSSIPETLGSNAPEDTDWSRFAYVQYVTDREYLCNSVMLFELLNRFGSKADRVMMYPSSMNLLDTSPEAVDDVRLLRKARDEYNVRLQSVELQHRDHSNPTWADSLTKLLVFNQTQYTRVLYMDSDSTVLQPMDELFLLAPCPVAMPQAYWLGPENFMLSSQLMLVEPSAREFEGVMAEAFNEQNTRGGYDMDILNRLYKDRAVVLPHRQYNLLTGEFRQDNHSRYLASEEEPWNPEGVLSDAKFLHFFDWPAPKPWIEMPEPQREQLQPKCVVESGVEQCVERYLWNDFYDSFARRRELVCKRQRLKPVTRSSIQTPRGYSP